MNQNDVLKELLGKYVEIRTEAARGRDYTDHGVIEACDAQWIKLRQGDEPDEGPLLYFPIANIRLVKPI